VSKVLPWRHALLALAVVAVWGSNFVVIKAALATLPPLLLGTLRFALAFLPAALFVKCPAVPWRVLAGYGVAIGAGQFGLLFVAMRADISPGLASLVVQTQVFWTIGLAVLLGRERPKRLQLAALALAAAGLGVVAWHTDATTTPLGLALVLAAALCWALGNTVAVSAGRVPMLAFMVWTSAFAVPPLLLLSLALEGPAAMAQGLARADAATWAAVAWQSVGNTLFGYGAWAWLMARHDAATVTPTALLVPVFGLGTSALVTGEPLQGWKLAAAALVIGGLALNLLAPRLLRSWAKAPTA
jgi:O-acetylserine/cysteine efflux transporter